MKVFLSYRRDDRPEVVRPVADLLKERLGPDNVFKDVDSIPVGANFLERINVALTAADLMFVVIGPSWLTVTDRKGAGGFTTPTTGYGSRFAKPSVATTCEWYLFSSRVRPCRSRTTCRLG